MHSNKENTGPFPLSASRWYCVSCDHHSSFFPSGPCRFCHRHARERPLLARSYFSRTRQDTSSSALRWDFAGPYWKSPSSSICYTMTIPLVISVGDGPIRVKEQLKLHTLCLSHRETSNETQLLVAVFCSVWNSQNVTIMLRTISKKDLVKG